MEIYFCYQIRIHLQLATQKPFRESLKGTSFLNKNSNSIGVKMVSFLMFRNILRKKLVLESLYIWRLSSKVTPVLLFSSEFCRFFKDIYLVENLRMVTSDRGSFSKSVQGHSKSISARDCRVLTPSLPPCLSLYIFDHPPPPRYVGLGQNSPLPLQFLYW